MSGAGIRRGLVCAHRGASLHLPDNKMDAFSAAIASGCEVIETDVRRRPCDGALVLAHDTWDVDDPDVMTLDALVDLARGRIGLDLEIVEPDLERAVLDVVDGFPGWLVVTSTFSDILREVNRLAVHIDTGVVVEEPYDGSPFTWDEVADPFALADACGALVTLVEDSLATPDLLARAAASGRPFWVWTVNDEARLSALLAEPAVTGVITDDPALAVAVRDAAPVDDVAAGEAPVH